MKRMVDVIKSDAISDQDEQSREDIIEELERTKWKRVGQTLLKDWRL